MVKGDWFKDGWLKSKIGQQKDMRSIPDTEEKSVKHDYKAVTGSP